MQPAPWSPGDPNHDTLLDWSELTHDDVGLSINSSQVDMFAIPHTVSVTGSDGRERSTGTPVTDGRDNVIDGLRAQPAWAGSVVSSGGTVLRVLAPGKAAEAGRLSPTYLDGYITSTWDTYRSRTLTVVPFGDRPSTRFFGRTSGDDLVRGTLGSVDLQPSTDASVFYRNSAPNLYGRLIHANMADGKAYAFDDVGSFESLVTDGNPVSSGIVLEPFSGAATGGGGGGGSSVPAPPPAPAGGQSYVSALNGPCLDAAGVNRQRGASLQLWDCAGTSHQTWTRR